MANSSDTYRERYYTLTLRTVNTPTGNSSDRRLAMLLKVALRTYGFKCTEVREIAKEKPNAK